ncbi:MAG: hypothetical protein LBE01_02500 [Deltaproteobacteria bacterium]|jgi:nitrogenase molybdenum-iron protein beta chain|nr:hypothetical protein [Deltaproteobacteria bacterium]
MSFGLNGSFLERPRVSCSLGGALAAAGNIPNVAPILHAGPGCAGNFAWANNGAAGLAVTGPCLGLNVPATNIQEREVVFGGIERLREEILNAAKIIDGQLYFVLTGCLPEVIGDDVEGLVAELSEGGLPLIMASAAGFKGDSDHGYEAVLKALFEKFVKPQKTRDPNLVNLWGVPPSLNPFWRGDLLGFKELLGLLGLRANVFFGPEASLKGLKEAGRASLNVVVSSLYGLGAAELFQEKFGVGFVNAPYPIGASTSDRFLAIVGESLRIPRAKVKKAIAAGGQRHYDYLEPLVDVYNDMEAQRHALIVGDANYALALTDFFAQDLGWIPELTVVTNDLSSESQKEILKGHLAMGGTAPGRLAFESRSGAIAREAQAIWANPGQKYRDSRQPVFVAGSSLERSLAAELGAAHLSLTYPVANRAILDRGYVGYSGGLRLTEDAVGAIVAGR